ncbi:MAG: hypothetical protein ABII90_04185 [Bacteroidota bacterium]
MKIRLNSIYAGLIIGIIAPVIIMLCYWQMNFGYMTYGKFINFLISGRVYTHFISICVVIDLAAFFISIWRNLNYSARGVLIATFIYVLLVVYLRFFT